MIDSLPGELALVECLCGHRDPYRVSDFVTPGQMALEMVDLRWYPCRECTAGIFEAHPENGGRELRARIRMLLRRRGRPEGPMPDTLRRHLYPLSELHPATPVAEDAYVEAVS